jgi:hypothetical protein
MGGEHSYAKSRRRERMLALAEDQARQDIARATVAQLPGHLVEVAGKGTYTALEVDEAARVVYCWRESEPEHVWPMPFERVYVPFTLTPGPLPPMEGQS